MTTHSLRFSIFLLLLVILGASLLSAQSSLTVDKTSLTFIATSSGQAVAPQTVMLGVTPSGQTLNWSASLSYGNAPDGFAGSQNWLNVLTSPTNNPAPLNVSIGVTTTNLIVGTYSATILFLGSPRTQPSVNVTLCVGPSCTQSATLSPSSFTFSAPVGGTVQSQSMTITSTGGTSWSATTTTTDANAWLSVNPTSNFFSGSTDTATVRADPTGLTAGTYNGTVTIASGGNTSQASVTFTVGGGSNASLILGASTMLFQGVTGSSPPNEQLLILSSGNALSWTANVIQGTCGGAVSLVDVSGNPVSSGTTPSTTYVRMSGFAGTTCAATITISAPTAVNSGGTVGVNANFAANNGKTLTAKTQIGGLTNLTFIANQGQTPQSQVLAITDSGSSGVSWNGFPATDVGGAWLNINPPSGSTTGATSTTSVNINTSGLAGGNYTGTLTFTGAGIVTPVTVAVTLALQSPPALTASPTTLTFSATAGATTSTAAQNVAVASTQGANFSWTASPNVTWLSLNPNSGSTSPSTTMAVTANASGLAAGTYQGTITISAAGSTSQVVNVTFVVGQSPIVTLSASSLTFTGAAGSTIAGQSLQISTSGSAALSWTATTTVTTPAGGNWLQLSASSGTTPSNVTVTAITTGLSAGTYTGTIQVSSSGSSNVQTIAVTLTITPGGTLAVTPASLTFLGAPGGSVAPQTISISNSSTTSTGALSWNATATVSTPAGGNWLTVSPNTGSTPGTANIIVSPVNLSLGSYTGTVSIASPNASNTATVGVTLTVAPAGITVNTNTLTFTGTAGGSIASQSLTIGSTGAVGQNWTAAVATQSGGTWLSAQPTSGQTNSTMQVTATIGALAPGTYKGTVVISATDGNSTQTVNVTLTINPLAIFALSPQSLQFLATRTNATTQTATFDVQNIGLGNVAFTAAAATVSGGNWLTVSAATGVTPATLTVTVNPIGLAAGTFLGTIVIAAPASSPAINGPVTLNVSLVVDAPAVFPGGIVNGASFANDGTASPGELMSLFGSNLASATTSASGLPLPTTLGGTQVLVNGNAVPLFFTSAGQINFLFPEVGGNAATVTVVVNAQQSQATLIGISPVMPGIFSAGGGQGLGMILNQDFSANSPANPASAGQTVQIYATGLGVTFPRVTPGNGGNTQAPFNNLVVVPTVTIGGIVANVSFAAETPGLAGVYQVNAVVPTGLPTGGFATVRVSSGGKTSNPVMLATK